MSMPHKTSFFLSVLISAFVFGANLQAQPPSENLIAWYSSDAGVVTDENGVTIWEDQAGGDNDAVTSIDTEEFTGFGTGYPQISCGSFPGGEHAVVSFNGNAGMEIQNVSGLSPAEEVSIYVVSESSGGGGGNLITNYHNVPNWGWGYIVRWIGINQPSFFTSGGTSQNISDDNSGVQASDGYHLLTATISNLSGEKKMWLDGGQVGLEQQIFDFSGEEFGFGGEERMSIGSFREYDVIYNTRRHHTGGIAEILIYDAVDELQRSEVEEYLNEKYFDPDNPPPPRPSFPPERLNCKPKLDGSEVTLNWRTCGPYDSQTILRDGEELTSVDADATSFVDNDPPIGTVLYEVEASFDGGNGKSSCEVEVELPFFEGRILHLAADLGVINGPNGVELWEDQSSIAGHQDAFKESAFGDGAIAVSCGNFPNGSHPVLRFPGGNSFASGGAFGILDPEGLRKRNLSIYAVVEVGFEAGSILGLYSNAVNWGYGFNLRMGPGGQGSSPCLFTSAGTAQTIHDPCSGEVLSDGYHIITATISSLVEEKKIYVDGVLLSDSNWVPGCTLLDPPCHGDFDGRNMAFNGDERPAIGSFREFADGDSSRRYHKGGIAEIIVYDSVGNDQREMVEAELRAKYFEGGVGSDNLPPSGLVCSRSEDGESVQLNWSNCGTYEALNLFRNGALIFNLGETTTDFFDNFSVPLGDVTYEVVAEFEDGSTSGPSCTLSDPRQQGCPPFASDPRMVLWLDADQGVTSDANGVLTWNDLTGGGNDATTRAEGDAAGAFGTGYPQETTAILPTGEFPVLEFDGNTGMEIAVPTDFALTEVSMFVVAEVGMRSGQLLGNYSNAAQDGFGWNWLPLGKLGDATALNLFTSNGTCGSRGDDVVGGVLTPGAGTYAILSAVISNSLGQKQLYVDGNLAVNWPMGNTIDSASCPPERGNVYEAKIGYHGSERVALGSFREFDPAGTRGHEGGIAEVLVFDSSSEALREDVESYLTKKYFTGNTPTECPGPPDPTGACCNGASCDIETEADCTAAGGTYNGDDSVCGGEGAGGVICLAGRSFRRGDCDQSGKVDFNDAIFHLRFLFLGENEDTVNGCKDACDSDDSGADDFTDDINTLRFLFLGQGSIPEPGPMPDESHPCGSDPTVEDPEELTCETYEPAIACP